MKKEQVIIHTGLNGVREAIGMYLGEPGMPALRKQLAELLDNAIDEARAGRANRVLLAVDTSGFFAVGDNGGGIPVVNSSGKVIMADLFQSLHASGKFADSQAYAGVATGGTHGVGAKAAAAASELLVAATLTADGDAWHTVRLQAGHLDGAVHQTEASPVEGYFNSDWFSSCVSVVLCLPDFDLISPDCNDWFAQEEMAGLLQAASWLLPDVSFELLWQHAGVAQQFFFVNEEGPAAFFTDTCPNVAISNQVVLRSDHATAVLGCTTTQIPFRHFVNNLETTDALSKQLVAFRKELHTALCRVAGQQDFSPASTLAGLAGFISVDIKNPKFSGNVKSKLTSAADGAVQELAQQLVAWLSKPEVHKHLVREASHVHKKEQESKAGAASLKSMRERAKLLDKKTLIDCNKPGQNADVYLVEGDSAGAHAPYARDGDYQAIIQVGGKMPNVYTQTDTAVLTSQKVQTLVANLSGSFDKFCAGVLRYRNVYIATDPDVDGEHITYLLLCLFARFSPDLLRQGRVRVINTPLFKGSVGDTVYYGMTMDEVQAKMDAAGKKGARQFQRFKGLGEVQVEDLRQMVFQSPDYTIVDLQSDEQLTDLALLASSDAASVEARRQLVDSILTEGNDL